MARATLAQQRDPQEGPAYGLAYYWVSTSEQANTSFDDDGFSIQAQRDYCQRKAAELGVELVDEYTDRGKGARTAGRPALQAMLARIKEDTDIQYVFVHKLDRLARNRADDVQISLTLAKHGVRLVSCTENIDDSPSGKLVRGIMADIAEWCSANLSQEAKKGGRGRRHARQRAPRLHQCAAQDYRARQGHRCGSDARDVRALITECFKLYDIGSCTIGDVVAHATDHGLRLAAKRRLPERPLRVQHMQRILRNRYYTGWVSFGGVAYQGEHPALIDEATFDRVQALLTARNLNKDKSRKRPHHLKGSIFCARGGRRFGICAPTKKRSGVTYSYFYCLGRQNGKNDCPQTYIPIGDVEDAVRAYWAAMRIPAGRVYTLRQAILDEFADKHEHGQAEIAKQRRRIIEFEQRAKAAYYAALEDALQVGLVSRNVSEMLKPPKRGHRETRPLSVIEVRRYLDVVADDRFYALYVLALSTGMREGELLGLRWQDVDLARRTVQVRLNVQETLGRYILAETKTAYSRRTVSLTQRRSMPWQRTGNNSSATRRRWANCGRTTTSSSPTATAAS
ncbi:MAG TPA: recombinase family protein [Ktedonobacterales bacterium]|nr:recombinase family protein [Ktedonobacterales bacterium]